MNHEKITIVTTAKVTEYVDADGTHAMTRAEERKAGAEIIEAIKDLPLPEQKKLLENELTKLEADAADLKAERKELMDLVGPELEKAKDKMTDAVIQKYGTPAASAGLEVVDARMKLTFPKPDLTLDSKTVVGIKEVDGELEAVVVDAGKLAGNQAAFEMSAPGAEIDQIAKGAFSDAFAKPTRRPDKFVTTRPLGETIGDHLAQGFPGGAARARAAVTKAFAAAHSVGASPSLSVLREKTETYWKTFWAARAQPPDEELRYDLFKEDALLAAYTGLWRARGFPTFELTASLAAALAMTECRGLYGRDLRLPFPAFAVQMPRPSPLVYSIDGAAVDCTAATVARVTSHGVPMIAVTAFLVGSGRSFMVEMAAEDELVDTWLRRCATVDPADVGLIRFLVNLSTYINSLHAMPSPDGKRKPSASSRPKPGEPPSPLRWVFGREIKLSPGLLQAARVQGEFAAAGEKASRKLRASYHLHARFMVRGHWRNQAVGKGRLERRKTWVAAFWKGPALADGLARLYAVAGNE